MTPAREKEAGMKRRIRLVRLVAAVACAAALGLAPAPIEAQQRVQVEFWHGLGQPL